MRVLSFVHASTMTPPARIALEFCMGAHELGHEVILCGLVKCRETPGLTELGAAADAERVPFRLLQQRYRVDPGVLGQMEMMFRRLKPDYYLCHDFLGLVIGRLARYRPAITAYYAHEEAESPKKIEHKWMGRRLLKLCDVIVAERSMRAKELESRGIHPEKIVIKNPNDNWIGEALSCGAREKRAK